MTQAVSVPEFALDRVARAVEIIKQRLHRATRALNAAGIPYAIIGGNAVAEWVGSIDVEAVRTTRDVDILVRREQLPEVIQAITAEGFEYANVNGVDLFIDIPHGKPSGGVHLIFSGEKVKPDDIEPSVTVDESEMTPAGFRVLTLEALVKMKLLSYRFKDRAHLLDLIDVGLIDATWPGRFQGELAARLQMLFDNPGG